MFLHIGASCFYLIAIIGTMQNVNMDMPMLHNKATTDRGRSRMLLAYIMVDKVVSAANLSVSK